MSEWAVFGVIITLLGFLAAVVTPVANLTRAITRLSVVVDNLGTDMAEMRKTNAESKRKLWQHNEEQDEKLCELGIRVSVLEGERHE
ncbi:MAG: hypothetical protein IJ955_01695 [Oscillospiraceae bacterium]|nr:hypothetical protein [Oscillospiraceae bacterium]